MAIQVNGTTVIDNSRNLTNITSVDATTAAAIGNAGVGGGLSEISHTTLGSTYSNIDVTLDSGYHFHRIVFSLPVPNTAWNGIRARFFDGSNNLITGYEYDYKGQHDPSAAGGANQDHIDMTGYYHANNSGDYIRGVFDIYHARNSTRPTYYKFELLQKSINYLGGLPTRSVFFGWQKTTEVNTKIRFFPTSGSLAPQSGRTDFITKYGV